MKKIYASFLLLGLTVSAQQGTLDNSFNERDNGTYKQLLTSQPDELSSTGSTPILLPDGKIVVISPIDATIYRFNSDGSIDNTFQFTGFGSENRIPYDRLFLQRDGKIIVVYQLESKMMRLNADGTIDFTFAIPEFLALNGHSSISDVDFQEDGKIIVTGNFISVNNIDLKRFVRLNTDGSIDITLNMGLGFNGSTNSAVVQPDGKIIVCGNFTSYSTSNIAHIARMNPDGSVDTSFNLSYNSSFYESISNVGVTSSGQIIVSGTESLFRYNNQRKKGIVRLNSNGSYDNTFDAQEFLMAMQDAEIPQFVVQSDGKIVINLNGNSGVLKNYYRLTSTGALDTSFVSSNDFDGFILRLIEQPDGKIIIGGSYNNPLSGVTRNIIHRISPDGSIDLSFMPNTGTNFQISRSFVQQDGMILLLGKFTTYNDQFAPNMARIDVNGNLDTNFNFDTSIELGLQYLHYPIMQEQPDGKILISPTRINYLHKSITRINRNGSLDTSFNCEVGTIEDFDVLPDGRIMAVGSGGSFSNNGGYKLLRLQGDGNVDMTYPLNTFNQPPLSIELIPDGKVLVAGSFTNYNNSHAYSLIRLNSDGTKDESFVYNSPVDDNTTVLRTLTQPDGKILISFTSTWYHYTSIARLNIDGTVDNTFTINEGSGDSDNISGFKNLILLEDGSILVKRFSNRFNYQPSPNLIKLNANGTWDNTFDVPDANQVTFYSLAGCDRLIATGSFASIGTTPKNNIAAINISDNPVPPVAEQIQFFSNGQTLADLIVEGENLVWYSEPFQCDHYYHAPSTARTNQDTNSNEVLSINTPLVDGTTYYVAQTVGGQQSLFTTAVKTIYSATANLADVKSHNTVFYPNPTTGMLTIEAPILINEISVYNTLGQLVLSRKVNTVHADIDLSGYNGGIYTIRVMSDNSVNILKVLKK
jgi:uncharacterized delta-60 repeat protein